MEDNRMVSFSLGGMAFEYDDNKNQINIKKHGISFKSAARIFFDYDRIEFYDEDHSYDEDRYNTIGDTSAGRISQKAEGALIGNIDQFIGKVNEILFVVYTPAPGLPPSGPAGAAGPTGQKCARRTAARARPAFAAADKNREKTA